MDILKDMIFNGNMSWMNIGMIVLALAGGFIVLKLRARANRRNQKDQAYNEIKNAPFFAEHTDINLPTSSEPVRGEIIDVTRSYVHVETESTHEYITVAQFAVGALGNRISIPKTDAERSNKGGTLK